MRIARLIAAALFGVAAIVASGAGSPAGAHEEVPGVQAVLDTVEPRLPGGVRIEARISVADQLIVENRTQTDLFVLGDDGEPFLRIGPQGTFANVKSPSWYRSNDPTGAAVPPEDADPKAEPVFARVTVEPAWGWFDHRLHRGQLVRPPKVEDPDKPVVLEEWTVPMRYGDLAVSVKGHREYKFPSGAYAAKVKSAPSEVTVLALHGVIPALTVQRRAAESPVVTILGEAGEPMARLSPEGVEVNDASPTWAFTQDAKGAYQSRGEVGAQVPPRWVRQSAPQLTWLDRRGQLASHEPKVGERKEWRVPVLVGDRRAEIVAETTYERVTPGRPPSEDDGGGVPWWWGALGGLVAGVAVLVIRGKIRMTRPSSSGGLNR